MSDYKLQLRNFLKSEILILKKFNLVTGLAIDKNTYLNCGLSLELQFSLKAALPAT